MTGFKISAEEIRIGMIDSLFFNIRNFQIASLFILILSSLTNLSYAIVMKHASIFEIFVSYNSNNYYYYKYYNSLKNTSKDEIV